MQVGNFPWAKNPNKCASQIMHMKTWQQNPAHEFFLKIQGLSIGKLGAF